MPNIFDLIDPEGETVMFIKSLVGTTASASNILKQLSAQGLGIRKSTGLQVINYLRNTVLPSQNYVKYINLNSLPNPSRLPLSITRQLRNYAYNIALTGFSNATGELTTVNITISSNSLLTKQQALDLASNLTDAQTQSASVTGASGQVTSIFANSGGIV